VRRRSRRFQSGDCGRRTPKFVRGILPDNLIGDHADDNPRLLHGAHEIDDYVRALIVDGALPYSLPPATEIERSVLFDLLDDHARRSGPKRPVLLLRKRPQF